MYVMINQDAMCVRHKHHDLHAICAVTEIEDAHCRAHIIGVDTGKGLDSFTDFELKHLYLNTTGETFPFYSRDYLIKSLLGILQQLPESDINKFEAQQQASKISLSDDGFYRYVRGSFTPAKLQELYVTPPMTTVWKAPAAQAGTGRDHSAVVTSTRATNSAAPAGLTKGSKQEIIYTVADEIWEKAGKPSDVPTVLKLRKRMMEILVEQHGVNKGTASCSLGDWQKQRLK